MGPPDLANISFNSAARSSIVAFCSSAEATYALSEAACSRFADFRALANYRNLIPSRR